MKAVKSTLESPAAYVLGHSERELNRLTAQAHLIDPITRQIFQNAGIIQGMRVLDVGSGAGDTAFLAAEMVGNTGEVVGVDRSPAALVVARARAKARSLNNVDFQEGDLAGMTFEQPFDAVIGRYVLQFQNDPAAMLSKLARHIRPGGTLAFHELDWDGVRSFPPVPAFDQCCKWLVETLRLTGTEARMGIKLYSTFLAAGLPAPAIWMGSRFGGGADSSDQVHLVTDLANTLLPEMERLGVTTASEVGIETLAERMINEAINTNSIIIGHLQVGAWTHV